MDSRPQKLVIEFDAASKGWKVADGNGNPVGAVAILGILAEVQAGCHAAIAVAALAQFQAQVNSRTQIQAILEKKPTR